MPRHNTFHFAALLAMIVAVPRPTHAQATQERAVRAVVDSFFAAVAREQWDSATALIDVPRFEPYLKQQIRSARTMLPQREMTVEEMMATDSTMPRAVAEWQLGLRKRYKEPAFGDMSYEFSGVKTLQALFALTLPEAVARWLQAQDSRTQMRESLVRAGCPLAVLGQFPVPEHTVLAIARADDSTAYAVHVNSSYAGDAASLFGMEQVMILHRSGARWRIEPRRDLLQPGNTSFGMMSQCPK